MLYFPICAICREHINLNCFFKLLWLTFVTSSIMGERCAVSVVKGEVSLLLSAIRHNNRWMGHGRSVSCWPHLWVPLYTHCLLAYTTRHPGALILSQKKQQHMYLLVPTIYSEFDLYRPLPCVTFHCCYRGDVSHDLWTVEVKQENLRAVFERAKCTRKITWQLIRRLPNWKIFA